MQTTLLGCTDDVPGTLDHLCCGPCMIGRQCAALEGTTDTMNAMWCMVAIFTEAYPIFACCLRGKLDTMFNMNLGIMEKCCLPWFCSQCALCQNHRELTIRGKWPGGTCCTKKPFNMN